MRAGELLAEDLGILRETIRANDGANVATAAFARKVDQLISDFYDDIEIGRASCRERVLDHV